MSSPTPSKAPAAQAGSDARDETLSAWLDGELDAAQAGTVTGELIADARMQRRYARWCLVGDALRSQEVAAQHAPDLCARISRALEDEPALLAPRALPQALPRSFKRNAASGAAVAAAFAVVAFFALPQLRNGLGDAAAPGATVAVARPPAQADVTLAAARSQRLDAYLQAHRELAGSGVMPAAAVYLRTGPETER